ncbi:Hypothetical predicted protein [Paramuricea clavata]|uniref:Uncharacterized protein n=1 Tax=Paramuricea clavata TaxID=317549 RepID=A0A7D9HJH7_PARCT|nr:Hypothetical predicted protein [Paramuricea clavata]
MPTADNEILHQRSLTKEEITFPKIALTDTGSLEINILAGVWNENTANAHCHEEFQLEKYAHSFLSSPDHVNEFEETCEPAIETDFPNKKQKMNFEQSYELWLRHGCLNGEIGESVEQYETEFDEHPRTKIRSATTFEHDNQGDTLKYSEESLVHARYLTTQIVPDMYNAQDQSQAQPMKDSSRAVPSGADDVIMDSTNTSLQYSRQSHKTFEAVKEESCITPVSYDQGLPSQTAILARQGRRKLRVGLSKSTRVKPLHPYWSKDRIKESGPIS